MVAHEQDDEMAEALEERVKRASRERKKWSALRKAFSTSMSKQAANYQRMKDIDQREKRLQKVREETLLKPELIVEAVTNMEKAGFRVRMAMDAKEALTSWSRARPTCPRRST
jgi:L-lactate utilization protein LutB